MMTKTIRTIQLSMGLLALGAVKSQSGTVTIMEYDLDYPNGQFMGAEDWPGVRGNAMITDQGAVFGGDLYWDDGGQWEGEYWGEAQDYGWYEEPCRSYTDDCG